MRLAQDTERLAKAIFGTDERAESDPIERPPSYRPYRFAVHIRERGLYGMYVVAARVKGVVCSPVKIGITDDPVARMGAMQCNNHLKLVIHQHWWVAGRHLAARAEKNFKLHNKDCNIRGEWYDMDPDEAVMLAGREIADIGCEFQTNAAMIEKIKKREMDILEGRF